MSKVMDKRYLTLGLLLGALLILVLTISLFSVKKTQEKDSWIIRSVDDTVVLMNKGEVVEVFDEIVVDTLPKEDIKHLEMGISFLSRDEAMTAIEDYDG
jgi:hypothetical protein